MGNRSEVRLLGPASDLSDVTGFGLGEDAWTLDVELALVALTTRELYALEELSADDASEELGAPSVTLAPYPGPKTPNFDTLRPDARRFFTKADRAYYEANGGKHLLIESGLRDVYKQAELYTCWQLGKPGCNPADIPGVSVHNYGFAIDIINARDPKVIAALGGNGWKRTAMPKEPWHWEATAAKGYAAAVAQRNKMRAKGSLARTWQATWHQAKDKNDDRNAKIRDFNARAPAWRRNRDRLDAEIASFRKRVDAHNSRVRAWRAQRDKLNARVDRYNAEVAALRELRSRIEGMEPSPERNRLIREYNRRTQAAKQVRAKIEKDRAALRTEREQIGRDRSDLDRQHGALKASVAASNAEAQALDALRASIETLKEEIAALLTKHQQLLKQLARIVHP